MSKSWKNPLYIAQVLSGLAAVGAIFADGNVTALRVYIALVPVLAMVASLLVVARTEDEAARLRHHVETLLKGSDLPYVVIEELSGPIKTVAADYGWQWDSQENFVGETVYTFQEKSGQAKGRLVVADAEFKTLWLLKDKERQRAIVARLFGESDTRDDEYVDAVVREAVAEEVQGPHWLAMHPHPDGSREFTFSPNRTNPVTFLVISVQRRNDLQTMVPLRRYAEVDIEARKALRAILKTQAPPNPSPATPKGGAAPSHP